MQRRVTLLRHGHAAEHPDDFSRTLSDAGRAAAAEAGVALRRAGWTPEHVLTSAAPRALVTAELAMQACGYSGPIQVERALYLASSVQCRAALQLTPTATAHVLLVGHNPGLTELARDLSGRALALSPAEYVSVELALEDWFEL